MKEEIKYFYIKESAIGSMISDTYTIAIFVIAMGMNHYWFGDNNWFAVLFIVLIFVVVVTRGSKKIKKFKSDDDLIAYLKK